jgi:radical SAM family uncharacterized protein/radical SAM-linked protein
VYEDFLPLVTKPGRYINSEINAVHKDHGQIKTRICLFFPDVYEVGMSHLGLRILYHILNKRSDTVCERAFSPWPDYEERLRAANRPLTSLESNTPLREFDIIGFTLQYELSYSNILVGLDLAGIPLHAKDRSNVHPVIIAGGPCAVNPEPLSAFIDAFFIGEAEEAVTNLPELQQRFRDRTAFLEALSREPGWHVPASGRKIVRRQIVADLERAPYPEAPLVPLMRPIHDRVTVEIARGCIRGCRFCQAGVIYRPYRERSAGRIKGLLEESLRCTGYDELSLASLSSGDHSEIQPLMQDLADRYRDARISLSLPSLRIGTLTPGMIRAVAGVRKTGFTLAPEAGTERLRRVINKPVSDSDLIDAARTIFSNGWNVMKLYFMIGLPTETDEDLDGIIRLAQELFSAGKSVSKRHLQLNITVSTFVPKPHTPFQWFGQATREEIRAKQAYLARGLRKKGITVKPHDVETSLLEGAFARGDSGIGRVLEEAVRLGCRFDGWSESFDFKKWEQAFQACGLVAAAYANRSFDKKTPLPWDFIHTGVTNEFLRTEYDRACAAEITANCRESCEACGMGCTDGGSPQLGKPAAPRENSGQRADILPLQRADKEHLPGVRIRMKFSKTGRIRLLSHLDLMTLFQRAAARAGVPVAFSLGFNPHPRIAFGPALSVGMESESEFLDLETILFVEPLAAMHALNLALPAGIIVTEARIIPQKAPSLSGSISRYVYGVTAPQRYSGKLAELTEALLSRHTVMVVKDEKQKDIRACIETISVQSNGEQQSIEITLKDQDQVKPRIQDVVAQLFAAGRDQMHLFGIVRRAMFYWDGKEWQNPMNVA